MLRDLAIASANGLGATQIVEILVAGGGLVGAFVALLKLRPDANTAAVTQSQSAMETMARLNADLENERDGWRRRALDAEEGQRVLRAELEHCQADRDHARAVLARRQKPPLDNTGL
jgi:hypothetical protein